MSNTLILIVVILVLSLAITGAVAYSVFRIRRKIRSFSRQAFGTDSISEGLENIEKEYSITPKSVSAMTSLYLPQITKDFPDFSYDEMKEKAQNTLTSYLLGVSSMDTSKLKNGNSDLAGKLEHAIAILRDSSKREHFDSIKLHRTEISKYARRNGRCIITFQSAVQYYHYITDTSSQILSGSNSTLCQARYETDLIYIQDRGLVENTGSSAIGLNCPNCGAPITSLGQKHCEYCGSAIIEINIHAFSFGDVRLVE